MTLQDYNKNITAFFSPCENATNNDEGEFSWRGCDIIHDGHRLGRQVYKMTGFDPVTKDVFVLGYICAECLLYVHNGDLPDFIEL